MFSGPSFSPSPLSQLDESPPCEEHSSSPAVSSSGVSLPTTPSPRPRGTAVDFIAVNWSLWGRQEWAKWPGFERYTGGQDTRAWWQQYGYRVEDRSTSRPGNKLKWICADCFARGFKKKSDFCFVCSTGASIKKHLRTIHGIFVCTMVHGVTAMKRADVNRLPRKLIIARWTHYCKTGLSRASSMPISVIRMISFSLVTCADNSISRVFGFCFSTGLHITTYRLRL